MGADANRKTTIYLPENLKRAVAREARRRNCSEAQVIRQAVAEAVRRPRPRAGIIDGELFGSDVDDSLEGFGER